MNVWTTHDLPTLEQFSYWREVICQAYIALDTVRGSGGGFGGHVTAHPLAGVNVTTISSSRQRISRGRAEISRAPEQVYFLNLQMRGRCRMSQGGRSVLLDPGEFSVVDSTEPYLCDYCSDDWEQFSFRIPRHLLRPLLAHPDYATATKVVSKGGIGTVVIDHLTSVARNAEQLSASADQVTSSMIGLIALSLGSSAEVRETGRGNARKALCASVTQHIERNIADPDLSPAKVAARLNVSPRYIHKVLEEEGRSFGRLILDGRLERCAKDLAADPGSSISDVALRWGFNDVSHFSKTFRQRFGTTPRDFRRERV